MRVLIVKVSAMGDIVHALPVLDYLHQVSPGIEVDWVAEAPHRDVLEGNRLISSLHLIRTKAWRKTPFAPETRSEFAEFRKRLQERKYDIVFDIQGNLKSGVVSWLSGGERRYGFDRENVREWPNLLFTTDQVPLRRSDQQVSARSLRVVSVPFGKDYQGMRLTTDIFTPAEEDAAAEAFLATLADGLVFLFHPGTTWKTKLWHEEGWVELGRLVLERFPEATILLSSGNETERGAVERIGAGIGKQTRPLPKLSLKGLTAFLKKVDFVVGGDTGPVHLAAAVGTPTVSFYRATDSRRNGPVGANHFLVQSPMHCNACLRKECDKDEGCRRSIKPEMLMKGIEHLFECR
jgi:heptosyltransferase-1